MIIKVPMMVKVRKPVSESSVSILAVPKSIIWRYPSASTTAFSGFKSRYTIEFL